MVISIFKNLIVLIPLFLISGPFLIDLAMCLLGLFIIYEIIFNKNWQLINNKIFFFLIIFWLIILTSSFASLEIKLSLEASLFYFRFILFSLAIGFFLNKYVSLIKLLHFSIWLSFLVLILDSHLQFLIGKNIFGIEPMLKYRISSFFGEELIMGSYLSRILLIGLILLLIIYDKKLFDMKKTLFYSLAISLIGSSIFLSGERSAMFYYFLTIILSVIFSIKLRKIFLISFCILTAMIALISIKDYEFSKRMFNYTIYEIFPSKSEIRIFSETHQAHYETAIKMFKDKPLIGHGPKTFRKICNQEQYYVLYGCSTHPHNTYLQLLSETGLIGFIPIFSFFIYILFFLTRVLFKKIFYNEHQYSDTILLLYISFFIYLWPIIPNGNFFNNWMNGIYYLLIGISMNLYLKKLDNK